MKVAIYCRVSTDEQTTENQKIRLVEYAHRQGWQYEIFEETMSSRKTRPVKQHVLQLLRNREVDGLLIFKLDRWARSTQELIMDFDELYRKNINIISISDNIDLSTATGRLQFEILACFASFERSLIRERTMEGLHRAKLQGKKLGRPSGSKDSHPRRKSGYYWRYLKNSSHFNPAIK
ncbi:recombinase family protein [Candidatus Woesearchaeota archaeon]|nr:recombinase family protein [Candidatus Woesearchaeota archaeon]